MSKRRGHGDGAIDARGENTWRLRYRIDSRRFTKTVRGTKCEAQKALRELLHAGDEGGRTLPRKSRGSPNGSSTGSASAARVSSGARSGDVRSRAMLNSCGTMWRPQSASGHCNSCDRRNSTSFLRLFTARYPNGRDYTFTIHSAHAWETRFGLAGLIRNPINDVAKKPDPGEADHGAVLDADQLRELVAGFKGSSLYPIVAVAVGTGARRNEILGLQWTDLDAGNKTLRIERAVDEDAKHGLKGPKKERHKRTIAIDDDLVALLLGERERHLRIAAGVPDGAAVDLSLVKLPSAALMFPSPEGKAFDFTRLRDPHAVTRGFSKRALKIVREKRFKSTFAVRRHETAIADELRGRRRCRRCGTDAARRPIAKTLSRRGGRLAGRGMGNR